MPNIAQLPLIPTATTATSFVIVNDRVSKRISYPALRSQLASELSTSESLKGPIGISGYSGVSGYQGVGISGYSGFSGFSGLGLSGYSGFSGTPGAGIPEGGTSGQALVKTSNNNYETSWATVGSGGSPGVGLSTRITATATTGNMLVGATTTLAITGFKSYVLLNVSTSSPAWVRIYTDATRRNADSSRSEGNDPIPGSGVIAEVITTSGNLSQIITPGVFGFNDSSATTVYLLVTNKDSVERSISVSLKLLQLEA
jgi:hypothetical protein